MEQEVPSAWIRRNASPMHIPWMLIFMVNVGIYTSSMDRMGMKVYGNCVCVFIMLRLQKDVVVEVRINGEQIH